MPATLQRLRVAMIVAPLVVLGLAAFAATSARAACDGGGIAWIRGLSSPIHLSVNSTASTPDGGIVVAGTFNGALLLDAGETTPQELSRETNGTGSFVLKLSSTGKVEWLRRVMGVDQVTALLVKQDGGIVVGGSFRGKATLEGKPGGAGVRFPGDVMLSRLFVAFYAPDGAPRAVTVVAQSPPAKSSSRAFPPASIQQLTPAGDGLAVLGGFSDDLTLGADARHITLAGGASPAVFLALVGGDGAPAWALRAGGPGAARPGSLAVLADGSIAMTGVFSIDETSPVDATVGEGSAFPLRTQGRSDQFIARVSLAGRVLWAEAVGGDERPNEEPPPSVAYVADLPEGIGDLIPTADGGFLVAGQAPLPLRFGRDRTTLGVKGRKVASFWARLSAAGRLLSAVPLGGEVGRIAQLPGGDFIVGGSMEDDERYPAAGAKQVTLLSAGMDDALIARHGPDGSLRWAMRLGGAGQDYVRSVMVDAAGAVTLGTYAQKDFAIGANGCRPVRVSATGGSTFLIRLETGAVMSDEARTQRLLENRAKVKGARAAATRAFKAKRYEEACPLYQRVADLAPEDAGAQANLGLCWQRLGRTAEAIAANRRAITLAAPKETDDNHAQATRRHAYYNLAKMDEKVKVPDAPCGKLEAAPGCSMSLWVCKADALDGGSGGETNWTVARIGVSADEAEIEKDEKPRPVMPSLEDWGPDQTADSWPLNHNFANRAQAIDVLLDQTNESYCPDHTSSSCGESDGTVACNVVIADACTGLVATACTDTRDKKGKIKVDEFYLWPAK